MKDIFKKNWFTIYMFLAVLLSATMLVKSNNSIDEFKRNSVPQVLTIKLEEESQVITIKDRLQRITGQPVHVESLGENTYKILLQCPPEKFDQLKKRILKAKIERNM